MARKQLVVNAGLAVTALLLSAVLAEIVLRIAYKDKFGKRPGFFVADQALGWRPASNLNHTFYGVDFSTHVRTDAEGNRLGALGEVDFTKELVILCGDSYTFGWGVSTGETVASYLDDLVTEATNERMRVLNLGVAGYGTLQSHTRLARFMAAHDARITAVLFFHSPNDPVDNLQSIGYHIGVWKVFDRQPKARNPFHIVNFFTYAISAVKYRIVSQEEDVEEGEGHLFLRDAAFALNYELPRSLPETIEMNGRTISFAGLSDADFSKKRTVDRANLTKIQKDLMREGIRSIQLLLAGRDTKVFHIVIPSAPDWYLDETMTLLREVVSPSDSNMVIVGRFLNISEYGGTYQNDHRGKHYNPEFNEYWAGKIMELLEAEHITSPGD
ncbi:MAG: SGNH/GDSL hydrolase family protein [Gammaproteobacteria bacterium]|nr:SGNH/GDSL hydrolase family protein [Gammaproteobacteria bacterium]